MISSDKIRKLNFDMQANSQIFSMNLPRTERISVCCSFPAGHVKGSDGNGMQL